MTQLVAIAGHKERARQCSSQHQAHLVPRKPHPRSPGHRVSGRAPRSPAITAADWAGAEGTDPGQQILLRPYAAHTTAGVIQHSPQAAASVQPGVRHVHLTPAKHIRLQLIVAGWLSAVAALFVFAVRPRTWLATTASTPCTWQPRMRRPSSGEQHRQKHPRQSSVMNKQAAMHQRKDITLSSAQVHSQKHTEIWPLCSWCCWLCVDARHGWPQRVCWCVLLVCRMVHSELQHCRWSMLGAAGILLTSVSCSFCLDSVFKQLEHLALAAAAHHQQQRSRQHVTQL